MPPEEASRDSVCSLPGSGTAFGVISCCLIACIYPSSLLANLAPVIAPVTDTTALEGDAIDIPITASDPDSAFPILSAANLPAGAAFTDNLDGTGNLTWRTSSGDAGEYTDVTLIATDTDDPLLTDSLVMSISVAVNNQLNFTRNTAQARLHGVHEITLPGSPPTGNPFDIPVNVTFTPPSGAPGAVTVDAFFDGGNLWKARVYINETGNWTWSSSSSQDPVLDGLIGSFTAVTSSLGGMLGKHPLNPRQLSDETGATFLNLSDTAYRLFSPDIPFDTFVRYVEDDNSLGITSLRAGGCGGYAGWAESVLTSDGRYERSNWCWDGTDTSQFDLAKFRSTDERLEWLLNNHPGMYIQLILFGKTDNVGSQWFALSSEDRNRIMDYQIARWGAFPQLFFLIVNDTRFVDRPLSQDMVREIGNYFAVNDAWKHLISAGPKRREPNPFVLPSDLALWHNYIHEEKYSDIDATKVDEYSSFPLHLYYGEDWYEQSATPVVDPANPDYFQRRLFWSALLSGGSAAYGGRYPVIHPYTESGSLPFDLGNKSYRDRLSGLDSVNAIRLVLQSGNIDLALFTPDDSVVRSPIPVPPLSNNGPSRIQATRKSYAEILAYLPNATSGELAGGSENSIEDVSRLLTAPDSDRTPQVELDLHHGINAAYDVTWFHPETGEILPGNNISGGGWTTLTSPWTGTDAVLHVRTTTASLSPPVLQPISNSTGDEAALQTFTITASDADGTIPDLSATGLPDGATFTDNHDGTATFSWVPGNQTTGSWQVTFIATDALDPGQTDRRTVLVTVNDTNVNPVILPPQSPVIGEGTRLDMTIRATDTDGNWPLLDADPATLPVGASFTDNNDGTARLVWTPQAGATVNSPYLVTVIATNAIDNQLTTRRDIEIVVFNNLALAGGSYNGVVGSAINFDGSGSIDLDGDPLNYSWNFGDGSPPASGPTPAYAYTQQGIYTATLMVDDGSSVSRLSTATVTVTDVLQQKIDGLISLEAENADANISRNGFSWTDINSGMFSGGRALQATPTSGPAQDAAGYSLTSPQLDFLVNFSQTGTHYVWVRGIGQQSNGNSVHVGLDGMETVSSQNISFPLSTTPVWYNGTNIASFEVATTSVHTINVWMRETGFIIDKLIVTTDANFVPAGFGPAEFYTNQPPVAVAGSPYTGAVGSSIDFNGAASFDPDADPLTYVWDFGDGSPLIEDMTPRHTYRAPGTWLASLTVNDGFTDSLPSTAIVTVSGSNSYQAPERAFTLAHRGGAGEAPENTLAAFGKALGLGSGIEMDVRLSSDNVIVAIHDATVDRTTNGTGNVSDMTVSQLKALDAGSYFNSTYAGEAIPTLDEIFALFVSQAPADAFISIDTKVENAILYAGLVALLDQYALFDRAYIEVSSTTVADEIRAVDPRVQLAVWRVDGQAIEAASDYPFFERIHAPAEQLTLYETVRASDMIFALTVNSASTWNQVRSVPIGGIITDYPELMTIVVNNRPANASITANTSSGIAPLTINFDAASTTDPDGSIASWQWDFGDGSSDNGASATYTYMNAGTYTVTLTVTDNIGATSSARFSIAVQSPDQDGDGVLFDVDNCPDTANPDQLDTDNDGVGNVCDSDMDNDGLDNDQEALIGTDPLLADTDGDGLADSIDPVPLQFNFADGDLAPPGMPDGIINAADRLIMTRLVLGTLTPTTLELGHGDLYPADVPDGIINVSDLILLDRLIFALPAQ